MASSQTFVNNRRSYLVLAAVEIPGDLVLAAVKVPGDAVALPRRHGAAREVRHVHGGERRVVERRPRRGEPGRALEGALGHGGIQCGAVVGQPPRATRTLRVRSRPIGPRRRARGGGILRRRRGRDGGWQRARRGRLCVQRGSRCKRGLGGEQESQRRRRGCEDAARGDIAKRSAVAN